MTGFRPEEEPEILSQVAEGRLGGVILFARNGRGAMEVARLCGALRNAAQKGESGILPIVAVDQEQGRVCRIRGGVTHFPGASELGELDRPRTTERVARWVAQELSTLGVSLNLAPVADVVMRHPPPPVLAGRAFGSEAQHVARHVGAWVRGAQGASVAACAKHFPGHGAVQEDSHEVLPHDPTPLKILQSIHLKPFESAIRCGVASIMVGHVVYEALGNDRPASLSCNAIQGLLREKLGYNGLILTDDLEMDAVGNLRDPLSAAIQAIRAGADVAVVGRHLKGNVATKDLIEGLEEALNKGFISEDRVFASIKNVLAFKRAWIPSQWTSPQRPPTSPAARRLAKKLKIEGRG